MEHLQVDSIRRVGREGDRQDDGGCGSVPVGPHAHGISNFSAVVENIPAITLRRIIAGFFKSMLFCEARSSMLFNS
jgi:hypothetical protein